MYGGESVKILLLFKKVGDISNFTYRKDLNMAIVLNHVSLNYSYFSQAFKEYTSQSFVN
ncbi:hypothetical protein [Paenibacillus sp. GP183]|uniref:hypothetical protein n=1 Tax=Paenibacillus sp. GP183 TaxID=1882751 RepID=UPI000AE24B11|nr:hypothetical protein [Paenibacillus sp. GP183]